MTHRYLDVRSVAASVDITYIAEFRFGGSGWQSVPGSATAVGEPVDLEVVEATPRLVG